MLRSTATNLHRLSPGTIWLPNTLDWTRCTAAMGEQGHLGRGKTDYKLDNVMDPQKLKTGVEKGICKLSGIKLVVYGSGYEYEDVTSANRSSVDIILCFVIWIGTDSNQCELFGWMLTGLQKKFWLQCDSFVTVCCTNSSGLFACMYDSSENFTF